MMEGVFESVDFHQPMFALKQEGQDPVMSTFGGDDLELFSYLSPTVEGQALDETVDLDVIPQPHLPSPSYESEGVPSPSGMEGGMSPVSSGGNSLDVLSELQEVDFSELMEAEENDGGFELDALLQEAFQPNTKPENSPLVADMSSPVAQDSSEFDHAEGRYNLRRASGKAKSSLDEPAAVTVVKAGNLPSRSSFSGPKVIRVESRKPSKQSMPVIDMDENVDKNKKNAIQARINRQKKKAYIEGLEGQVSNLKSENHKLKSAASKLKKEKDVLTEEVAYLRNVLANDSALSGLLQNIGNTKGIRLSTSFSGRKRASSAQLDHDYGKQSKSSRMSTDVSSRESAVPGGVCLHVDNENVSLEFCSACARMAKGSADES